MKKETQTKIIEKAYFFISNDKISFEKTMLEGEMYNEPGLIEHIFITNSIYRRESNYKVSVFYDKF